MSTLAVQDPFQSTPFLHDRQPSQARPSTLQTTVLSSESDFNAIREEWDQLIDDSDQRVYFLRWPWNRQWWVHYAPPGSQLMLITVRDQRNRLLGLAPFYWKQCRVAGLAYLREVNFLGAGIEMATSEYLDVIARRGYEKEVAEKLADFLKSSNDWDHIRLWGIPFSSRVLPHLHRALGQEAVITHCDHARYIDVRSGWETVRNGMNKKFRCNLERAVKHLFTTHNVEFRKVTTSEAFDEAIEALIRLHQARWQSKGEAGSFAHPLFGGFLRRAGQSGLIDGRLRFWTLSIDGRIAAALIGFYDNGIVHYFQGGFDLAYAKDSLGSVMVKLCIQDCIDAEEVSIFDFMGGSPEYKKHWTSAGRDIVELQLIRRNLHSLPYRAYRCAKQSVAPIYRVVKPLMSVRFPSIASPTPPKF